MSDADEKLQARGGDMGVRVKPLVWVDADDDDALARAESMGQEYSVGYDCGAWFAYSETWCGDVAAGLPTVDAAKAAAQADYEARILAALEPAPLVARTVDDVFRLFPSDWNEEALWIADTEAGVYDTDMPAPPERIWIAGNLEECGNYYAEAAEAEGEHGGAAVAYVPEPVAAPDLAELVEALKGARWRMKQYNYQAMQPELAAIDAALAKIKEPQHG